MKIMPGVRVRASSRGFSAGIGPRAARVHVGTRGVGVSTGVGPFGAYGHLGGGSRRRSTAGGYGRTSGGPTRATLAALEREARQADKDAQIRKVAEIERQLVSVHRERFARARRVVLRATDPVDRGAIEARIRMSYGIPELRAELEPFGGPPQAPWPEPVDREALLAEEEKRALDGISVLRRAERKRAKAHARAAADQRADRLTVERAEAAAAEQRRLDGIWEALQSREAEARTAVEAEVERLSAEARAERDREQAALDAEWQQLIDNDPATAIDALEAAFADNGAPATPIDCDPVTGTATVTMLFGHPDLVPERTPAMTPGGKPTLRKRTKSDRNDLYLNALASNVLATVKEGFAVAPGLAAITVLVVRRDPFASGGDQLVAVYAATFDRTMVADIDWENIKPANLLDAPRDWLLNLKGQAADVAPLDLREEPDLQAVLEQLAEVLSIPPLRPKPRRPAARAAAQPAAPRNKEAEPPRAQRHAAEVQGMNSPDDDVRYDTITRLRERRDAGLLDAFVQALHDTDPFVRRQAADALGDLEDARCRPILMRLLDDPDADMRYAAIQGLSAILDPSLVPALRDRIQDSDPYVRRTAVSSLARVDPQASRELLRSVASQDPDADVRYDAVSALGDEPVHKDGDTLAAAARDRDPYTRRAGIGGLRQLRDQRYTTLLIDLTRDSDDDVRYDAVGALGDTGGPGAVEALRAALDDPNGDVRQAAKWGLGDLTA
jgi:HEAT repeat protein